MLIENFMEENKWDVLPNNKFECWKGSLTEFAKFGDYWQLSEFPEC